MKSTEKKTEFDWPGLLQALKEKIAKLLWNIPGVAEGERELAMKDILWELDQLQGKLQDNAVKRENMERILKEENDLLRSLLGTNDNELKGKILVLSQEMHDLRQDYLASEEDNNALRKKAGDYAHDNDALRLAMSELRQQLDMLKAQEDHDWQKRLSGFSDEQAALHEQMLRLAERMREVQKLATTETETFTREKQAEFAALQTKLIKDMETTLSQREDLLWAEEELFARGVAQKLRGELQAAMGRLQLTLEKFHLLESPGKLPFKNWDQWWRLIKVGPEELRDGFADVSRGLDQASKTLEEYMALTHRKKPIWQDVSMPELARQAAAERFADRMEKGALDISTADALPPVQGDAELLKSIMLTLLDNAFQSLKAATGRVRLRVEKSPDGKELWLNVADDGEGISPGRQKRLFQPFFTTKPGHRGLGLVRARRHAEWHRGRVDLVDSGEKGSTFRLSLPLARLEP